MPKSLDPTQAGQRNKPIDRYAVVGNPIQHSKSPAIHARFAEQTGQAMVYEAMLVEIGGFEQAVEQFRAGGGRGLNITLPFKEQAWAYAGQHGRRSDRAERAGAVNTLVFNSDGGVFGDNTDGHGLVNDLIHNHGAVLAGAKLLLLGAGGAARGVLQPLLTEQPKALIVANRTPDKATALANAFTDLGPVRGCGLDALADGQRFDMIINATAASLDGAVPPLPETVLATGGWCYDLMYANRPTAFVRWGSAHGAVKSLDGLGMLVEQAAEAFCLWRGVRPETGPVIAALR